MHILNYDTNIDAHTHKCAHACARNSNHIQMPFTISDDGSWQLFWPFFFFNGIKFRLLQIIPIYKLIQ